MKEDKEKNLEGDREKDLEKDREKHKKKNLERDREEEGEEEAEVVLEILVVKGEKDQQRVGGNRRKEEEGSTLPTRTYTYCLSCAKLSWTMYCSM